MLSVVYQGVVLVTVDVWRAFPRPVVTWSRGNKFEEFSEAVQLFAVGTLQPFLPFSVEGLNPAPHIHEQMTTSNYGYDIAYNFTHNNIMLEHNAMNNKNTIAHMDGDHTFLSKSAIIDSEIRFLAEPTTDVESIFVNYQLVQPRVYRRLHCHAQFRIHRRRCQLRAHREGICNLLLEWRSLFGLTAIDVPAIRGTSWILVDVFMRKCRVKIDVKECVKHYSRCGGQRAVECGDDPPGGLSTLSAHQMAG